MALAFARDRRGGLVAAAALDAASRRSRAPFTCPGCGAELTARLGAVRARHFAHRPGSTCPLTAPETALHFNAKARLLALCALAFEGRVAVRVRGRCERCRRAVVRDLATAGDAAVDEAPVAGRRADVLVTRRGAPALAIEVLVTHALEPEKLAALAAAGVPAIELDATTEWEALTPEGVIELASIASSGLPPCRTCSIGALADADRALGGEAAQVAELESYRARGLLRIDALLPTESQARVRHDRVKTNDHGRLAVPDPESFAGDSRSVRRAEGASKPFAEIGALFRCPDCAGAALVAGPRLALHPCPVHGPRPIAWVGYDGRTAVLGWWKR